MRTSTAGLPTLAMVGAAAVLAFATGYATGREADPPGAAGSGPETDGTSRDDLYAEIEVPQPPTVVGPTTPPSPR